MRHINVQKPVGFDQHDLKVCQPVFDRILEEGKISKGSEESDRIARIVVDLYRQGVREPHQLMSMVAAARGIFH
jgi:hypothetical protein